MTTSTVSRRLVRRIATVAGAVVVLSGVAACSGENVAEEIAERAIERESGGKADVELDGDGGITIESDEGTLTVDPETGEVIVEGQDGSSTYQGVAGEVPAGFPREVPLVKGTITYGQSMQDASSGQSFSVIMESQASVADVFAEVKSGMAAAGFTVEDETVASGSGSDFATGSFANENWRVTVVAGSSADGPTSVTYAVTTP